MFGIDLIVISIASLAAALLTLFSGFGLGTLLMPIMAIFFPVDVAIAITALVHFANNLFKGALFFGDFNKEVLMKFGIPAMIFAFMGAFFLEFLSSAHTLFSYEIFGRQTEVKSVKFIIGALILIFVAVEISPKFKQMKFEPKFLPIGGALSGFFGGLSGHQGAFRSMFLIKCAMDKKEFVATGVFIAIMVDAARLMVYGLSFSKQNIEANLVLVLSATIFA
ncbi:sulfite exporter TauE/SafE family protein, partial [Campylobacter sp.]|uniref:sulfite exporter TauE/SafE family protein n=1 Tax=Campylobacter sp. TaxID=205 RepID=UPI002709726C|nr:sulfite exporter TauE/SafE family protein [Campylobacter sp.]